MCELLALSASLPTQLTFSLHTLASHSGSGEGGSSRDGWGVAFYQGADVALFREPQAADDSALVRYLETQGPSTHLAISHIRHATRGAVQLSNTQPFVRELGGRSHVFAHNGDLPGVETNERLALGAMRPIGQTDSEHAFCALLARLHPLWRDMKVADAPPLAARMALVATFAAELRALGPANFLYADGDVLFAHSHRRKQRGQAQPGPPGLWLLQRHCSGSDTAPDCDAHVAGIAVAAATPPSPAAHIALLLASVPLTDEAWRPLAEGELVAVRDGELLATDVAPLQQIAS